MLQALAALPQQLLNQLLHLPATNLERFNRRGDKDEEGRRPDREGKMRVKEERRLEGKRRRVERREEG